MLNKIFSINVSKDTLGLCNEFSGSILTTTEGKSELKRLVNESEKPRLVSKVSQDEADC